VTEVGALDAAAAVEALAKAQPDYVIFQGYVLAPIPDVIRGARERGLATAFMGTFGSMDESIIHKLGRDAEGYLGVNPYAYWHDGAPGMAAMRAYNERVHPGEKSRPNSYVQGWFTGKVHVEAIRRTMAAGKPITGDNLRDALDTIRDWDTGGVTGKVTFVDHRAGVGRVYRADVHKGAFEPASEWIYVK